MRRLVFTVSVLSLLSAVLFAGWSARLQARDGLLTSDVISDDLVAYQDPDTGMPVHMYLFEYDDLPPEDAERITLSLQVEDGAVALADGQTVTIYSISTPRPQPIEPISPPQIGRPTRPQQSDSWWTLDGELTTVSVYPTDVDGVEMVVYTTIHKDGTATKEIFLRKTK